MRWMVLNEAKLATLIRERQATLMRRCCASRDERFWFAAIAAILVGADLTKAEGLHDIDVARVELWATGTLLPGERTGVTGRRLEPDDLLGEFVREHLANMLVVARSRTPGHARTTYCA